jgi:hypothetical protein
MEGVLYKGQASQARSSTALITPGGISRDSAVMEGMCAWATSTHSGHGATESGMRQSENTVLICSIHPTSPSNECVKDASPPKKKNYLRCGLNASVINVCFLSGR